MLIKVVSVVSLAVVLTYFLKKFSSKPKPEPEPELEAVAEDVTIEAQESGSNDGDPTPPSGYYEVFLSFRGPDTRKGFTDCLYHTLVDARVTTFRDDEDLRVGEEIGENLLRAINRSKISIPIFSKNYASSKWCLKELTFMLEQKSHVILPIFYDVSPSEVQDQTGDYGRALEEHEKKYNPEIVKQWKAALTEVGHLKGMDLVKLTNGCQGQLIKLIVSQVLNELKKAHLIVSRNLVGVDDRVETVKQLLKLGEHDVRIVGIWGMGGIGKSTLAKVIYNQILNDFESCSFIGDIQETLRSKGLEYLQSSLVADLSRCKQPCFKNVDEGTKELEGKYRGMKVLIVLDDIDETKQLDALTIKPEWFGPGSRIMVTTRNRDILHRAKVGEIYEVEAMNEDYALKLLCRHAFRQDTPTDELQSLSCSIVETTGGLPLALEVIGSYLFRKCKKIWAETGEKLKRIPNEKVQDKLRISFNALSREHQQIFLDIACFFIGEDTNNAFRMWKNCKFFPETGLSVLVAQSLIKIGVDNRIWMHGQIRDLGREIVRQEDYEEPGNRSRLWCGEDAKDVFTNKMGSSHVKAMCVYLNDGSRYFRIMEDHLANLLKLRFLDLNGAILGGNFENCLTSLHWFRWTDSSFNSLTNLHLPNLVSLELEKNDLTDDWNGWGSVKEMKKLEVLNLRCSQNLKRLFNFSAFPNLERLILSECKQLEVIDPSLDKLKNLTYLDISGCNSIKELPRRLGLMKLEVLNMSLCTSLNEISGFIIRMTSLTDLALDGTRITKLGGYIGYLTVLRRLSLRGCSALTQLPAAIGRLLNLQTLDLRNCESLETLPALPHSQEVKPNLITLSISGCRMMKSLPSLSNLKMLKTLDAKGCVNLEGLEGLDQLNALESLDISQCHTIKRLPDLSNFKLLKELCISGYAELEELEGLDQLNALESLDISDCPAIKRLPDLSNFKLLKELCISGYAELEELEGLDQVAALESLDISDCSAIKKLSDLSNLKLLKELRISGCTELEGLAGLDKLHALKSLDISHCRVIISLPGLSDLKLLRILLAKGCSALQKLDGLNELHALKKLSISSCKEIKELPDLSKLKQLEELHVDGCEKLLALMGLSGLKALKIISVSKCKEFKELPDLSTFNQLEEFYAAGCIKLRELTGLDSLKELRILDISGCEGIAALPNLCKLWKLEKFDYSGCEGLIKNWCDSMDRQELRRVPYFKQVYGLSDEEQGHADLSDTDDVSADHQPPPLPSSQGCASSWLQQTTTRDAEVVAEVPYVNIL